MGKIDNNKQMKRESLLDSAFSLFIDNGFNKTSISDIVNNAGVAKGTFYLYFKDKYDIRNHLIAHKASCEFRFAEMIFQTRAGRQPHPKSFNVWKHSGASPAWLPCTFSDIRVSDRPRGQAGAGQRWLQARVF